jgi:hypothetical protein
MHERRCCGFHGRRLGELERDDRGRQAREDLRYPQQQNAPPDYRKGATA